MNKVNDPRLLDIRAASSYLGMTEAGLRKNVFLRRFDKALVRIGGRIYFDKEKLDSLLDDLTLKGVSSGS